MYHPLVWLEGEETGGQGQWGPHELGAHTQDGVLLLRFGAGCPKLWKGVPVRTPEATITKSFQAGLRQKRDFLSQYLKTPGPG